MSVRQGVILAQSMARAAVPAAVAIVYVGLGVVYLFPSSYLNRSASAIRRLKQLHRSVDLEEALEGQKAFWRFSGICMIGVIVGYAVAIWTMILERIH